MTDIVSLDEDLPYVRVLIETSGNLNLANVGRFLQRLDTGARRAAEEQGWRRPSIEIADLATGSLDLKIKIAGLRVAKASMLVSMGAVAVSLAQYLKQEPAAGRSVQSLIYSDRAINITVEGGGSATIIRADDVPPERYIEASRSVRSAPPRDLPEERVELLTGPQSGVAHRYGGQDFLELDARPGLFIRVRDERPDGSDYLEDSVRYTFEGEAHIPAAGHSFFVLRKAMRLG